MGNSREQLGSRLGFILISAGCAIGLGNIWRFPFITGQYGGAAFVLIYLLFLVGFALPVMVMEFSVGRASRMNIAGSFHKLEPAGSKWHYFGFLGLAGNYLLMMFYTVISGWMLAYCWHSFRGDLSGLTPDQVGAHFGNMLADPWGMTFWMGLCVLLGFSICAIGLRKGVERITKIMMAGLFVIILILVGRSVTLPGASEGVAFYLVPDFNKMYQAGLWNSIYAAMGQAFFTLSVGIGSMAIFGSYISKQRRLTGESVNILILDTFVALMAGMIIFPACFSFGVNVNAGPGLVFVTLPNVFNSMPGSAFWAGLFFTFMSFAALTTVVAVFENLVAFGIDVRGWSRKQSCLINFFIIFFGAMPCLLGFNVLSGVEPFGPGSGILDLMDFVVSDNLLPIGALVYLLFCCTRYGWGWKNFITEADTGEGMRFPVALRPYFTYIVPLAMLTILVQGYLARFPILKTPFVKLYEIFAG